jgi:peptidoglycan/xylan/chitin deacetylase (PgdA/CDA1 family)
VDAAQPAEVSSARIAAIGAACVAALLFMAAAQAAQPARIKVALTFDDLPLNGALATGYKQSGYARATIAVLKQHKIPPSYGFINAKGLERNPDGALTLQLWIASGNPLGNHTYSHINLTKNSVEDFSADVLRNEPVLELLTPADAKSSWHWFRYPYLHEGDTLEKRRAVRAFLSGAGYRVAQTTLDWEDYLWNSAHAACVMKHDDKSITWLRQSYLATAKEYMRVERDLSRQVFGRDINHVMLLHLGSFTSYILPDLFKLLDEDGYEIVTLEEAQSDPVYANDPDVADVTGGTLTELMMLAKKIPWPKISDKPREQLQTICK